tara:strand:+ start:412 stop:1827 length:1416 start_codon:yes stop_codon:yes gene_type:complete
MKNIEDSFGEAKHYKKSTGVRTFSVPFPLGGKKGNFTISTRSPLKYSKDEILTQACKLHSEGNVEEAAKYYQYSINQGFNDQRVYCNYGALLQYMGKLKEAKLLLSKAIELNPNFAEAYSNLGIVLKDLGNLKEAELSLSKAIEIKPDAAEAYSNLGTVLKDLGKLKEAELSLSKAIELKPGHTNAKMNRWQLFFDKKQFELALKDADSCNTELSRACALETLYALGRIDEIYERIDKTSKLDELNIRLAAFSSFIAEQEKKATSNNFCQNPLSFLYFSNIRMHLNDKNYFIKELIKELQNLKTVWEPSNRTTKNGFQTPIHVNLFTNSTEKISHLKLIILDEIEKYYEKFCQEQCSFIQNWPSTKKLVGWHVILKKQGYQSSHIHPAGWLSGVVYLKVVPPLDKDEGAIEFSLSGLNYSNDHSPKLTYQPESGDILLFPSSLHHRTIPFTTNTDRIVLAFDLMPNLSAKS